MHADIRQLLAGLLQCCESGSIDLRRGPGWEQNLHPAFLFEGLHHSNGVVFVCDLLNLVADCLAGNVLEIVAFFRCVETGLRAFFQCPMEARHQAQRAQHARGFIEKGVILKNAQVLGFEVGHSVEWVHQ